MFSPKFARSWSLRSTLRFVWRSWPLGVGTAVSRPLLVHILTVVDCMDAVDAARRRLLLAAAARVREQSNSSSASATNGIAAVT